MTKNPWTKQHLEALIGEEESHHLEFKSSRGLLQDSPAKFLSDLTCHVSAFLNSDGGTLIIGIEEARGKDKKHAEKAIGLSDGIPRSRYTGKRLGDSICGQTQPSVASHVQVFPVVVGQIDGEDLLAFVIDVAPGITAYQAADKLYYARRSFSSEAMEDKDIRLRMLSDDKPRGRLRCELSWSPHGTTIDRFLMDTQSYREARRSFVAKYGDLKAYLKEHGSLESLPLEIRTSPTVDLTINVRLFLTNIGTVTIRDGALASRLEMSNMDAVTVLTQPKPATHFCLGAPDDPMPALYPEMDRCIAEWSFMVRDHWEMKDGRILLEDVSVYLDNGPPVAVNESFNLTDQFRDTVEAATRELRRLGNVGTVE